MKYENFERAKVICEEIKAKNLLLDKLSRCYIEIFEQGVPVISLMPFSGGNDYPEQTNEFITSLSAEIQRRINELTAELETL